MDSAFDRLHRGVLVVDTERRVFEALRSLDIRVPLWCVVDASRIRHLEDMGLTIYAAYGRPTWPTVLDLAARCRTMMIAETAVPADALRALSSGAIGYTGLDVGGDELRSTVQGALHGEAAYPRDLLGKWLEMQSGRALDGGPHALTPRQREVLALIARGDADKEIARALRISTATAQKHVTNILERLGVPNRAAAVAAVFSPAASRLHAKRYEDQDEAAQAG